MKYTNVFLHQSYFSSFKNVKTADVDMSREMIKQNSEIYKKTRKNVNPLGTYRCYFSSPKIWLGDVNHVCLKNIELAC